MVFPSRIASSKLGAPEKFHCTVKEEKVNIFPDLAAWTDAVNYAGQCEFSCWEANDTQFAFTWCIYLVSRFRVHIAQARVDCNLFGCTLVLNEFTINSTVQWANSNLTAPSLLKFFIWLCLSICSSGEKLLSQDQNVLDCWIICAVDLTFSTMEVAQNMEIEDPISYLWSDAITYNIDYSVDTQNFQIC